jgi:hypothetical protein
VSLLLLFGGASGSAATSVRTVDVVGTSVPTVDLVGTAVTVLDLIGSLMAKQTHLEDVFIGTDVTFRFHIKDEDEDAAVNITGWALSFMVKADPADADDDALVVKTTSSGISISGSFDSSPAANTQRATVTLEDSDTHLYEALRGYWELKRTDAGSETVLGYGDFDLTRGVHR